MWLFEKDARQHKTGFLSTAEMGHWGVKWKICESEWSEDGRKRLEIGELCERFIVFLLECGVVGICYECQSKCSDLSLNICIIIGIQAKGGLNRLSGFEVHALSEISYSQVGARRRDSPRVRMFHSSKDAHECGLA